MKNWLILLACLVVGLLFMIATKAQDVIDYDFMPDRASRIALIDDDIRSLQHEKACLIRAKNRAQMRLCNR
jgi:hypothetical protein